MPTCTAPCEFWQCNNVQWLPWCVYRNAEERGLIPSVQGQQDRWVQAMPMLDFWVVMLPLIATCAPNIARLVMIALVLTPSTAEVERGFSRMNLIKTVLRTLLDIGNLCS